MRTPTATVSILLPFHNAAATLAPCLHSIGCQTLNAFEVLALDDGSWDESADLIREWAQRDPRVRLLQPGRVGLVQALNLGIAAARSDLIARMDADDLMHPERLARQVAYLAAHPAVALIASRVELFPAEAVHVGYREYIRWQNSSLTPDEIANNIYIESPFAHPSVMFRRSAVDAVGGYRAGPFPEDYDLWLRMHAAGMPMARLPDVLLRWREWAERTSRTDPRYARSAFDQLRAHYLARDPRLHSGRALVIWGAGRKTRQRAQLLIAQGFPPKAWIDIDPNKIGQRVWGIPVQPPGWLAQHPRPYVLIYVTNHGARDEVIEPILRGLGYRVGQDYLAVG